MLDIDASLLLHRMYPILQVGGAANICASSQGIKGACAKMASAFEHSSFSRIQLAMQ